MGQLFLAGLVMLVMAYPLTFSNSADVTGGRATRVHAAAVVGAALLIGLGVYFLLSILRSWGKPWIVWMGRVLVGVWFSLLLGYGFVLQADYSEAWRLERQFWADLLPLIPDAGPGTVVLVEPDGFTDVYQIQANTWNLPRVLEQLYAFPEDLVSTPRVYRLQGDWQQSILGEQGELRLDAGSVTAPPSTYGEVTSDRVIIIGWDDAGRLVRQTAALELEGRVLPVKQPGEPILTDLPHSLFYDVLVGQP